jgi:hypothetical protein
MKYIKVKWFHEDLDDPVEIYSEIDDEQCEHRKIEIFRDGHKGFADKTEEVSGSRLGIEPWPDLKRLGAEPEFDIVEIAPHEFETAWRNRYTPSD